VHNFAKDTGDFKSLSKVDMLVIAMGVKIAKEQGDAHLVRKEPQPLEEFKPAQFGTAYQKLEDEFDSDEDQSEHSSDDNSKDAAANSDDDWNEVDADRQTKRTKQRNVDKATHYQKKVHKKKNTSKAFDDGFVQPKGSSEDKEDFPSFGEGIEDAQKKQEEEEACEEGKDVTPAEKKAEAQNDDSDSGIDDEETGGEWVTQDNLYKHISKGETEDLILNSKQGEDGD
jgi:hypothetical protein